LTDCIDCRAWPLALYVQDKRSRAVRAAARHGEAVGEQVEEEEAEEDSDSDREVGPAALVRLPALRRAAAATWLPNPSLSFAAHLLLLWPAPHNPLLHAPPQDVDWVAHPPEAIIGQTSDGFYLVKRKAADFTEYGKVDGRVAKRQRFEGMSGAARPAAAGGSNGG
jgi:hypothetical protein